MCLQAGVTLARYQILAPVGAGAMGEVYRARDPRLGRDVAVKVLPERLANSAEALARFQREAKALAAMSHPNIVTVFDVGMEQGIGFAVMEYLIGETLHECIDRGALPSTKVRDIGASVAEGLAAAHAQGVVHRDLKPANVFLTVSSQVKILDFGLARFATTSEPLGSTSVGLTEVGRVMGTASFMSPEQVRGEIPDARGDIFSLGCVLYQMSTGRFAFPGESVGEVMAAILRDEAAELGAPAGPVPADLRHVIKCCLAKHPDDRFQSAAEAAAALRAAAMDDGGQPTAVVMRPAPRPCLAVLPLQNLSPNKGETEYMVDGMTEALIADLAKIRALRVVSRTTVMQFKDARKPLPEIARELQADAIVEGSVLLAGPQARITVQLIRADTDEHLWAESYQRDLRDILVLQGDVARAVAREISVSLLPEEKAHFGSARQVKTDVYDPYLKARHHINRGNVEDLKQAVEFLRQAIERDSDLALGYLGVDADTGWHRSPIWKGGQQ